jgi:hypothetical protein
MRESAKKKIEQENRVLLAAGFQPEDEGKNVLWRKNGMWFGRTAALQTAMRVMRESTESDGSYRP